MSDFEQPVTVDDAKATRVTSFTLTATTLQLTITRDGADAYARNKPVPNPADVPADYLAAITSWIARNLR